MLHVPIRAVQCRQHSQDGDTSARNTTRKPQRRVAGTLLADLMSARVHLPHGSEQVTSPFRVKDLETSQGKSQYTR